jgi:nitrogen fixation NifU-like protein
MTAAKDRSSEQEDELDDLYREVILDHYRNPHRRGSLPSPTASHEGYNPLCGDEVTVEIKTKGEVIEDIAFHGGGCSISQASASMMADAIVGKTVPEARALFKAFTAVMQGSEEVDPERLGDLEALVGVRRFPVRVKCATLAWHTLEEALEELPA